MSNTYNLGNSDRCHKNGAFSCKIGERISRYHTCTGIKTCKDNSYEYVSNDTICGMYISYYFERCVLFSFLLHHTAVNVSLDYTLLILLPPLCCNNLADTIKAL